MTNPFAGSSVGDFAAFGRYPQTAEGEAAAVEWLVLARDEDRLLAVSRYGLDVREFDSVSSCWARSNIRGWLNNDFYSAAFNDEEKGLVAPVNDDRVFLLSIEEAGEYFSVAGARRCRPTPYAVAKGAVLDEEEGAYGRWWLRSPYPGFRNGVYFVTCYGLFNCCCYAKGYAAVVRPALWIGLGSD